MKSNRSLLIYGVLAALAFLGAGVWISTVGPQTAAAPRPEARLPKLRTNRPEVRFVDASKQSGIDFRMNFLPTEQGATFKINLYDHGAGVAVGDINADGHDDVLFLNQLGANTLFKNRGDGTFDDVTELSLGLALEDRICVGAVFGDYDNDGDQDLYVTTTRGGNVLFQNQGQGQFEDITEVAGVGCVAHSQGAAFFDYDSDGDLDLFVTNTAEWTGDALDPAFQYYPGVRDLWAMAACPKESNVLFRNNGDGKFADVTKEVGLEGPGWGGDMAIADFDEDGDFDLLVTNMFGQSKLYRNQQGIFEDATQQVLGRTSFGAVGSKFFDFNNDGRLDLYIVDMHSDMWMRPDNDPEVQEKIARTASTKFDKVTGPSAGIEQEDRLVGLFNIQYDQVVFGNSFFKNLGNGAFEEISDRAGLETFWPWGIATGDFDNDGYVDAFIPSGMGYPFFYWPNALMMNNGDETFTDRSKMSGIEPPPGGEYQRERINDRPVSSSSRAAACGDFDGDGRLDIVVNNFNGPAYYFRNDSAQQNYVAFQLRGTRSNRDALGAVVKIYTADGVMVRQVPCAGGYLSQSSKTLHFGLGKHTRVDRAEILWPSGVSQSIDRPAMNTRIRVIEPSA